MDGTVYDRAAPVVAVFDLDGTITDRDTFLSFLLFVLRRRLWRLPRCAPLAWALLFFSMHKLSNEELKTRFLRAVAGGCRRAPMEVLARDFVSLCCARMIKPAARARIEWHRAQGHRLVLATAGLDLYAQGIGDALGFDQVLSTRAEWIGTRLTGALDGGNLRGERKRAAVEHLLASQSPIPRVFAYSDHHSDLALLDYADQAVAVDPTARLARAANARGIPVESWR